MRKRPALVWIILFLSFFIFFLISIPYFSGDVKNHIVWGRSILNPGPVGFYGRQFHDYSFPNYPPVSMLSFAAAAWFYDFAKNAIINLDKLPGFPSILQMWIMNKNVEVSFLKIPAILPYVLSGLVIFLLGKVFKKSYKTRILLMLIFLLNPAFIYLAVIWGQNDFTQVMFILGAILFLFSDKYYWSVVFAGLSILSKQTVLLIWGLFLMNLYKLYGIPKMLMGILASVILLWLLYLPFNEGSIIWPFTFYNETLRSTGLLVADNAINYWGALSRFRPSDSQEIIFNLKLEYWGFLFYLVLFSPILIKYLKTKFSKELFIYFLFMASIIYFFTLTRMHERYLIFGAVFAQMLVMVNRKYWYNLVFFSGLLFLNLYKGLLMPNIPVLVTAVKSEIFLTILAVAYLLVLIYNYYYFLFKLKSEEN